MRVLIYGRTSTKSQDISSQLYSLSNLCDQKGWEVINIFYDEAISGLVDNRESLKSMLKFAKSNSINKILVTEISRLSRNSDFIQKLINYLYNNGISLYIADLLVETLNTHGGLNTNIMTLLKRDIISAEVEITKTRSRLKRGYTNYIDNGGKVGRKDGYKKSDISILLENDKIVDFLKSGYSVRSIMVLSGKSNGLIMKVRKILEKNGDKIETKISYGKAMGELLEKIKSIEPNILDRIN
jgi:DNA invertase Pin-like site-specific DNA recombinase